MIFLKKMIAPSQLFANPSQIFANTQTKFTAAFANGSVGLKQKKDSTPEWLLAKLFTRLGVGLPARLGALFLFLACTFGLVLFTPSAGFAQTAQHELKGTVLPPANAAKGETKDISPNTTDNAAGNAAANTTDNSAGTAESNLAAQPKASGSGSGSKASPASGSAKQVPIEMTEMTEMAIEEAEEPVATTNNASTQGTGNATAATNASEAAGAAGAAGPVGGGGSVNATGAGTAGAAGGTAQSGTLNSMGDDEYFKVAPKEEEAFSWSGYFIAVGGLLLVLAVLWMMVWLLRKRGAFPGASLMNRNAFKVEATLPLGPKRCLMLVRFLNSRYLLGVTDQQITLIKELEEQDAQGNQSSKNVANKGSTAASAGDRADAKASGDPAPSTGPLDFAQALHEESQKNDGKLQL